MPKPTRKKVLLVPYLDPPGGGAAVGAWAVEALKGPYDLTVLTRNPVDIGAVNEAFGTTLDEDDATWVTTHNLTTAMLDRFPTPLALLHIGHTMRAAQRLLERRHFDAVLGVINEIDVGIRAIQYIHYPWKKFPRPDVDYRWYHLNPVLSAYRAFAGWWSGYSEERAARNVTVANSRWTARLFEDWYDAPCGVLYPPVLDRWAETRGQPRARDFIVVGRISPEKELHKIIEILEGVRGKGHSIDLTIAGHADAPSYLRAIETSAQQRPWISVETDLTRNDLVALIAQHRYGIHGMSEEHFGIAPAELQLAGCITFVPDAGGQVEIVENDERFIYVDVGDAIAKITRMLEDPAREAAMRQRTLERAPLFTERRFVEELRRLIDDFLVQQASPFGPLA